MYAVFYVVDLYFALVLNYTPGEAGRNLIFYMLGLGCERSPLVFIPFAC